ncbi:MAG: hypothetical protein WC356_02500 [Candidatus Micrarchaeia archaeon]|jgi:hypothetical protein
MRKIYIAGYKPIDENRLGSIRGRNVFLFTGYNLISVGRVAKIIKEGIITKEKTGKKRFFEISLLSDGTGIFNDEGLDYEY